MNKEQYVLAIDEGTTGTTSLVINGKGEVVAKAYRELTPVYPQPGWVEQDAEDIFRKAIDGAKEAVLKSGVDINQIKGIGITNQRETTVVWDKQTGKPVYNAVVWQCRRTADMCEELKRKGFQSLIKERTGLIIDAYFSATKLRWILDNIPDGQERARKGELLFGTVDSWMVWNLTGGKVHVTDYSNASRTMLFNINTLQWDRELLSVFDIPEEVLPEVRPSSGVYEEAAPGFFGKQIPIGGIAGDQQAALFGQGCFVRGSAKNTYGTGSFILFNTGSEKVSSENGLLTTIAWGINDSITYALEGSVFISGAVVQWLRDEIGLIASASESEVVAKSVPDNGGVYLVPAFTGLGAPYWDMYARGAVFGITRGTNKGHIVRAALEAIAYQVRDVVDIMSSEAGVKMQRLRVDGGGTANSLLMQFQSDMLGIPVELTAIPDKTALGAGFLAGLAVGVWQNPDDLADKIHTNKIYYPEMSGEQRDNLYHNWKRAVESVLSHAEK